VAQTELSADDETAQPGSRMTERWAWGICWLMFASTVLNYMDRQAMSLVGPYIKAEYSLNNADFGWVLAAFQLSYALFQVPAGFLVDRWNLRWTYAGAVAWWSLAGMAAAFSPSLAVLLVLRAMLGAGESFNWPCALRVTGTILPPADRSLGNGIFNSGAAIGAVITPIVVPLLTTRYGWRTAFVTVGLLGFVWVGAWLALVGGKHRERFEGRSVPRPSSEDEQLTRPGLSSPARWAFSLLLVVAVLVALSAVWYGATAIMWAIALLMHGLLIAALLLPLSALKGADWAESLGTVVRLRRFWILVLVSTSINICWHFLINWLPTYLKEDRELAALVALARRLLDTFYPSGDPKYLASGMLTAIPFLAADFGNLGGGAFSRWLAGRGITPIRARLRVMTACMLLITCGAWVGWVRSDTLVVVLIGLMAMGTAAFMANYFAFAQEVSARHTGLIVGFLGALGNLYAGGFFPIAGRLKDTTGGFGLSFVLVSLLPFVGLLALALGWGRDPEVLEPKPS
jgi:ACS family hexuronate transporter-like MFS transporter